MANDIWTEQHVKDLSPDEKSIPAAREVLKKGGFGTVEPTADGKGWWVVCRGITDTYQVSVRRKGAGFDCECNCPSPKYPCKHALALLFHLVAHPELRVEKEEALPAASDFEALVRAVFHNPKEDTPRLMFADWLEENDQPDRAALIRYQCEQARYKPALKRFKELDALIKPLVEKFKKAMRPLPDGVRVEFRRGFLRVEGSAIIDAAALPTRFVDLFRNGWVESLATFPNVHYGTSSGALPLAVHVGELDVSQHHITYDEDLTAVAGEAHTARAAGRLARVKVHKRNEKEYAQLVALAAGTATAEPRDLGPDRVFTSLTPGSFALYQNSGQFSGAVELTLSGRLGEAELETFAVSNDLGLLETLNLTGFEIGARGTAAMARALAGPLRRLDLPYCTFADGGFAALVSGTAFAGVEHLDLRGCELTDADLEALARSKAFPALAHIDLDDNAALTAKGARALLGSKNYPKLHRVEFPLLKEHAELIPLVLNAAPRPSLEVQFVGFDVYLEEAKGEVRLTLETDAQYLKGIYDRLSKCAAAKRVTHFAADGTAAGAEDVCAIAAGFSATALKSLRFSQCQIGNGGATALAEAFAEFDLRELFLRNCRVQAAGTVALVNSPLFARLEVLDLTGSTPGKAGVAALLNADVPPNLRELRVLRLDAADKAQLKKKYGKAVKG